MTTKTMTFFTPHFDLDKSVKGATAVLAKWHDRLISRRQLAQLDDAILRDIGVGYADAMQEARKPFWI